MEGARRNTLKGFFKENWLLVAVILYVLSPIDILPDSIPLIGTLDDTSLLIVELVRNYVQYKKKNTSKD